MQVCQAGRSELLTICFDDKQMIGLIVHSRSIMIHGQPPVTVSDLV